MTSLDAVVELLVTLDREIWTESAPDRFGHRHLLERRSLTADERELVLTILRDYQSQLLFEPGSGTFGFGISLAIYLPPEYPGLPVTRVARFTGKQFFERETAEDRKSYALFEPFIYTDRNRELRRLSGIEEPLRPMEFYDY